MSIINDALKKAEYLKKFKSFMSVSFERPLAEPLPIPNHQGSSVALEEPPVNVQEEKKPGPAEQKFVTPNENIAARKLQFKFDSPVQLSKIVIVVFVVSGCLLLLLGPWLYIWTGNQYTREVHVEPERGAAHRPPVHRPVSVPVVTESAQQRTMAEEERGADISQASLETNPPKSQYQHYLNPNVRPSIRPIPITLRKTESFYRLTGITVLNEKNKLAIINGKVLEIGQTIDGAEVAAIEEKKVTLKKDGKDVELILE